MCSVQGGGGLVSTMQNIHKYISHGMMCKLLKTSRCWDEQDKPCMCTQTHTHTPTRFRSLPKMSGLSSMRISPVINVLSLVRMTCSRKSWPKCFSTQAYWTHTHTHMHSWWDLIRERKHGNNLQRKQNRCCWLGGGGAHLLIWAVFVLFYWAGANKDICAAERDGDNGAGVEKIENIQTPRYTSCSDLTNTLALYNRNEWLFWRRAEGLQW